jgi:Bacterial PH domain
VQRAYDAAIREMGGPMSEPIFDKQDQLDRVKELLIDGEQLLFVLDCKGRGSGFLGVTDKRLILRDDGFAKFSKSIVSLPYRNLHAVGTGFDAGIFRSNSTLSFSAGDDDWTLSFKGDKAGKAYKEIMRHLLS